MYLSSLPTSTEKTRITIDIVEKFLWIQQTIDPMRYACTNIAATTNRFSDKLGHGGFGAVFKGVLLDDVHVAVKMQDVELWL